LAQVARAFQLVGAVAPFTRSYSKFVSSHWVRRIPSLINNWHSMLAGSRGVSLNALIMFLDPRRWNFCLGAHWRRPLRFNLHHGVLGIISAALNTIAMAYPAPPVIALVIGGTALLAHGSYRLIAQIPRVEDGFLKHTEHVRGFKFAAVVIHYVDARLAFRCFSHWIATSPMVSEVLQAIALLLVLSTRVGGIPLSFYVYDSLADGLPLPMWLDFWVQMLKVPLVVFVNMNFASASVLTRAACWWDDFVTDRLLLMVVLITQLSAFHFTVALRCKSHQVAVYRSLHASNVATIAVALGILGKLTIDVWRAFSVV